MFIQWPVRWLGYGLLTVLLLLLATGAAAHGVADGDRQLIEANGGMQLVMFIYLGAKHMVTGYDHLLFLLGVIFFLYRVREIGLYVTLFAVGHSLTLLTGVLAGWQVNAWLIDTIIGLSVVYKALDNLGAIKQWTGVQPDSRIAVFVFGLFHGLGLATKLQEFSLGSDGLIANIIAFNVGVELGQFLALSFILIALLAWRRLPAFRRQAFAANVALMSAGFLLMGYQLTGYFVQP